MFKGKRALITGGSRGIGREVVRSLSTSGADVIALGKSKSNLDKLVKELPSVGVVQVDLADWKSTRDAISKIGPVDYLVNSAGIISLANIENSSEKEISELLDIDVKAVINVSQVVVQGMKTRGPGCAIVNVSGLSSQRQNQNMPIYGAVKACIDYLTRGMSVEFSAYGIRVNAVNPYIVLNTEFGNAIDSSVLNEKESRIPTGKCPKAEEVAETIIYLLSENASNINGTCLRLDGGLYNVN